MSTCSKCGTNSISPALFPNCGCQDAYLTTIPNPSSIPPCVNPNPCSQIFLSDCITYTGIGSVPLNITTGDVLTGVLEKLIACCLADAPVSSGWSLTGNSGTVDGTNFLGTIDNIPFTIRADNTPQAKFIPSTNNLVFGTYAGYGVTGVQNVLIGYEAGQGVTTGTHGVYIGAGAGANCSASSYNIGIGNTALLNDASGSQNIAIGRNAGTAVNGGTSCILIGPYSQVSSAALTNAIAIGANATVGTSNTIVLGSSATTALQINGALMPFYSAAYNAGTTGQILTSQVLEHLQNGITFQDGLY